LYPPSSGLVPPVPQSPKSLLYAVTVVSTFNCDSKFDDETFHIRPLVNATELNYGFIWTKVVSQAKRNRLQIGCTKSVLSSLTLIYFRCTRNKKL